MRQQLRVLKDFIEGFDFIRMLPNDTMIKSSQVSPPTSKATVQALAEAGKTYAIYVNGGTQAELLLELPPGTYKAEWVNTKTGRVEKADTFDHSGEIRTLASPAYSEDIALRLVRQ